MSVLFWILPAALSVWALVAGRAFAARTAAAIAACRSRPSVTLTQRGEMRLRRDGRWLPFEAIQVIAIDRPWFAWSARFSAPLRVLDALGPDGGTLDARLLGTIRIAGLAGPEATRAQLLRYLAELPWCPRARAANPALSIVRIDSVRESIRASVDGVDAEVTLLCDQAGDVVEVRATRPRSTPKGPIDTEWVGRFGDHVDHDGGRVPTRGSIAWIVAGEEFVYWRARVTAVASSDGAHEDRSAPAGFTG